MQGILPSLLLIFIVLKLCGIIVWTWPLVLWPLWVMFTFYVLIGALALAGAYLKATS